MIIIGPVAISDNWVIGKDNDLPWNLPEDLKHFKEKTLGKTVVMGRKTFDSIFKRLGKPLPDRVNVVLTKNPDFKAPEGVVVCHSKEEILEKFPDTDIYVIGGEYIFKEFLPDAERLIVTHVKGDFEGDAFFPKVDFKEWELVLEDKKDGYTFAEYSKT